MTRLVIDAQIWANLRGQMETEVGFENGILNLDKQLPLDGHERVRVPRTGVGYRCIKHLDCRWLAR